jgi:NodT family efflux transporter outer membrane factor (OMF) lipoprotein
VRADQATAYGRATIMLCGVFALGACIVGPDFKHPVTPVAPHWSAKDDPRVATQTAADSQWWKSFNDATLDHLVALAQRQNLTLQVAGLRILEARAQLGIATGKQFPQLQQLTASATGYGLTKKQAQLLGTQRSFLGYQVGFDAVWELDFWGKYQRGIEAGAATLLANVTDYLSSLVSLTAEVARVYATIRTFEVLVQQAVENSQLQEEALRIAQARFDRGATSELDVTQATTLLEGTRATVPKLQLSAQQARNALSTLLGQSTGTLDTLLGGARDIPSAPAKVAVSVPAEMLRRRPDIRSAELYAAAQCARIGVAEAELYPSFSLFGSIGLQSSTYGPSLLSAESGLFSIGPRVSWPFFNYGRITNNVRVEDARFEQLLVGYRNTVLKAAQEVEDALTGFLNSQSALEFEQRAVTCNTAKARSTTNACSTRSARCYSARTAWLRPVPK